MNPLCSMKLKLTFRSKLQVPIYGAKFILKGIPEGLLFLPEIDGNEPVEGQIEILVSIRVMVHSNPYNPVPLFYSTTIRIFLFQETNDDGMWVGNLWLLGQDEDCTWNEVIRRAVGLKNESG